MAELKGSVGFGAVNSRDDVMAVQTLLKQHAADPGRIDGICGPKTIAAIKIFQKGILHHADGRVDPNGITWRKLTAAPGRAAPAPAGSWSGDSSKWTHEKKLQSMEPSLRPKVQAILDALSAKGFKPTIFFGWRSVHVQQELYKKGSTTLRFSFHNAQKPDGTPNSYAADIIDSRWGWEPAARENGFWDALGQAAKDQGLVWGGDWASFRDEAHVQSRQNSELPAVQKESGL